MKKIFLFIFLVNVFFMKAQQPQILYNFSGADGDEPVSSLISDGTYLYGTTPIGGVNNKGVIFRIKTDGTGFDTLICFNGSNGENPNGSLLSDGTYLYGSANKGGASNLGNIFKIKPDGTGFMTLLDFNLPNGAYPNSPLISDGTYLYGINPNGGANYFGNIFKIKNDGTNFQDIFDFDTTYGSAEITSALASDGVYMYGMTFNGGANALGNIFKVKFDGTGFQDLYDFIGGTNGDNPSGSLVTDGTYLYGITDGGGISSNGVLFKIKLDGTGYQILYNYTGAAGAGNQGSIVNLGNYLYGTVGNSYINTAGYVFKIKNDGTDFQDILNFNDTNGYQPYGAIYSDGNDLYGTTNQGGANNLGVIYKLQHCIPPTVSYTLTADITPHVWDVTTSISGGVTPHSYSWDWGDGTTTDTLYTSHTYTAAALYNVCLTVTDTNGCSAQYCENDNLYRTNSSNTIIQINVVENTTNINQLKNQNNKIKIYPNPTSSILNLSLNSLQSKGCDVQITDLLGNEIIKQSLNTEYSTIDIEALPNGVYFIRVGNSAQKFVVQH